MWRNVFVWHIVALALFNDCPGPHYFMVTLSSKMLSDSTAISLSLQHT